MATQPRPLRIVGGDLALDFANTIDDPTGPLRHDHLGTAADLTAWARQTGALSPRRAEQLATYLGDGSHAATTLDHAHRLRAAIADLFGAVADGHDDLSPAWTALRPFVADATAHAFLIDQEGTQYHTWSHLPGAEALLHGVAAAAGRLVIAPDLARVARCGACPWLFVDRSKNRSRRWCDMDDCGKARKMERYVARRAARRAAERGSGPGSSDAASALTQR